MSSHPDGGMPQGQQQLDISKADTIQCEECGNAIFHTGIFLKENISTDVTNR